MISEKGKKSKGISRKSTFDGSTFIQTPPHLNSI
jgi:hypothetical protein